MIVITEITDSYYYTERLQHDLDVKTKEVVKIQRDIIASFAAMIEARDGITGLHIKNTGNLVTVLVNVMKKDARFADKITDEYAEMTAAAARLHDIGKIAIPDRILQKAVSPLHKFHTDSHCHHISHGGTMPYHVQSDNTHRIPFPELYSLIF